jgi:beta-phosphoglucomutase family hydrolase
MSSDRPPEVVIFDMDGLMVDTERLHHESFSAVLKQYGVAPIPNEQGVIQVSGVSADTNWDNFKQRYGFTADNRELSRRKSEIHATRLRDEVKAMPGLLRLLGELRTHKIKLAIASSSIREHIGIVTDKLSIADYFDAIVSGEEVTHGKPAPDIFLRAAQRLGVVADQCVVLEDASSGVRAAGAAGMRVVAVPNEFTMHEDFSMADITVESLERIDVPLLTSFSLTTQMTRQNSAG